jgi:UDP-galactopyranose mutase
MYDYLIVGAGLFGATMARRLTDEGKSVVVVEKRKVVGGNCSDRLVDGVFVSDFGGHIFHTNSKKVWDFVNRFDSFKQYHHKVIAIGRDGKVYSLPFNMWTFNQVYGLRNAKEVQRRYSDRPHPKGMNLEDYSVEFLGREMYEVLVRDYTRKQWGKDPRTLPASIISRLPVRFSYNGDYFSDTYQGLPVHGFSNLVARMLDGIPLYVDTDYLANRGLDKIAKKTIYSGPIDRLFNYNQGILEYRSLEWHEFDGDIGCATVNYCGEWPLFTRTIDYRYIWGKPHLSNTGKVFDELPVTWEQGRPRLYPVNDRENNRLASAYMQMAREEGIIVGGRLGKYRYYDMDQVIGQALTMRVDDE